jgi:hypothetical protein
MHRRDFLTGKGKVPVTPGETRHRQTKAAAPVASARGEERLEDTGEVTGVGSLDARGAWGGILSYRAWPDNGHVAHPWSQNSNGAHEGRRW